MQKPLPKGATFSKGHATDLQSKNLSPSTTQGLIFFVKDQINMDSAHFASENPFELPINPNSLYNRVWMMKHIPGMHKNRIHNLEKSFGLLPLNSGNREAFFVYRGMSILEAMEKEAYGRRGEDEGNDDE